MTLTDTAAEIRARLAAQLYDEWGGYYILRRLIDGRYQDVRPLTREEAETIRLIVDEALMLVWRKCNHNGQRRIYQEMGNSQPRRNA